ALRSARRNRAGRCATAWRGRSPSPRPGPAARIGDAADRELGGLTGVLRRLGGADERLRRDAAEVEAIAPHRPYDLAVVRVVQGMLLGEGHFRAEARASRGHHEAARPCPDDDDVEAVHESTLLPPVADAVRLDAGVARSYS